MHVEEVVVEDGDQSEQRLTRRPPPDRFGPLGPWIEWLGVGRLVAAAVTIVVLVAGGWWLLRAPAPPTEAGLPYASPATSKTATATTVTNSAVPTATGPIVVHVAGAVANPGVYELSGDARVHVAIDAAGGPRPDADAGALNLAAGVVDGERVYVPVVGETIPPPAPSGSVGPAASTPNQPIDLNRASADELDELPGIGPTTAAAIVDHREQHGPFASVDDLEAVRGIGPAKLAAIRDLVAV